MKNLKVVIIFLTIILVFSGGQLSLAQEHNESFRWYKGNTHTHTLNSDGDSTPGDVVRWYREHGYHFLVITDHDYFTNVDAIRDAGGVPRVEEIWDREKFRGE